MIVFYNEAAGKLLGRRFEESGPMTAEEWGRPTARSTTTASRSRTSDLELPKRMTQGTAGHARFHIRSVRRQDHLIEASAMPIVATGGQRGGDGVLLGGRE